MAAPRLPIVVGILVLGGGLTWLALRDRDEPARAPIDPQGSAAPGSGKAAIAAPEGPSLGSGSGHPFGGDPAPATPAAAVADAGPSPQQQAFTAQTRDPAWAGTTEAEIKRRLATLKGAKLEAAECRDSQCELTIGGSTEDVTTALSALEGFRDIAQSMVLTAPEMRDNKMVVRAYLQFDRNAPSTKPTPK